jgi:hypothetical protein
MGRVYTAQFGNVAATAAQDFFELLASATQIIIIHSIFVGQSSDAGDAQAEMLRVQIKRASGTYTGGSGGSTPTAAPHNFSDTAFSGTVEANNTTQATAGSGALTTILEETFNVQAGWYYTPTPEERIVLNPSQALVVSTPSTPADSLTISGRITFEVLGTA